MPTNPVDTIRERWAKVSTDEWETYYEDAKVWVHTVCGEDVIAQIEIPGCAEPIAHAPTDIATLLALVEELERENADMRETLERIANRWWSGNEISSRMQDAAGDCLTRWPTPAIEPT